MTALQHTWFMTVRHLRALWRQPWWIVVTLIQPIIWLLLYGALFKRVVEIPGFHGGSYIEFLTPGVIVMTAFFSAGWGGMAMIEDIDRGVTDRFLVSPAKRSSLISGRLLQSSFSIVIQSLIVIALALIVGASFSNGVGGVALLILFATILGASFGALSNGLALMVRKEETLIAMMQFLLLPLTFLSGAFMQLSLVPAWIQHISDFNPVNWAVEAGRSSASSGTDWGFVASRFGFLLAFLALSGTFAVRALRRYQQTV